MTIAPTLSYLLNFLRWFAAFLVVIDHLRSFIFIEYNQIISPSILDKLFYFMTGLGHEAVIVFFVLSGYLVGGELLRNHSTLHDLKIYFIKRFSRIYTVFLPALFVGGILDYIGVTWFNASGLYSNAYHISAMNFSVMDRLNVETFFINLGMMQTSLGATFGSNGPLWSLANEWWYYISPLLFLLVFKFNSWTLKIISIVIFLILLIVLNSSIILYASIWFLGMLATKIKLQASKYSILGIGFLVVLSFFISRTRLWSLEPFYYDLFIAFAITILLFVDLKGEQRTLPFKTTNKQLADFSYTLYLFHFPFVLLGISIFNSWYNIINKQPTLSIYLVFTFFIIASYFYTYLMSLVFEKNTRKIRKRLEEL